MTMFFHFNRIAVFAVIVVTILCTPTVFAATDDACTLLTQAQVTAAVGTPVAAGTHVTPTFTKTCTWTPTTSGTGIKAVTLNLQTASIYDGGKSKTQFALGAANASTPGASMAIIPVSGLGDDAYFFGSQGSFMLFVKKGAGAFKVAIYGKPPSTDTQTAEKNLAQQVLAKM